MNDDEHCLSMVAGPPELETVRGFLEQTLARLGVAEGPALDLVVAVNELVTNCVVHGYGRQPGPIELCVRGQGASVEVQLRDQAPAFDPTTLPPLRTDLPPPLRAPGGLGIQLARHFSDELRYRSLPEGGNELIVVKHMVRGAA